MIKTKKVIDRSTVAQFKMDFGRHPPLPFTISNGQQKRFHVNFISSLGKSWLDVTNSLRIMRSFVRHRGDPRILFLVNEFEFGNPIESWNEAKEYLFDYSRNMRLIVWPVFLLFLATAFPFFLIGFCYLFVRSLIRIFRSNSEFDNVGGFYSPIPECKHNIYVNLSITKSDVFDQEHVITHEHIHFLQYQFAEVDNNFSTNTKRTRNPGLLFEQEYSREPVLLYLLERNEVEARLHEIVLSSYRHSGRLPTSLAGFLRLVSLNKEIGIFLFKKKNSSYLFIEDWRNEDNIYKTRSESIGKSLRILLANMLDTSTREKFAVEVLAPMYFNLLSYYGDIKASDTFGRQIERPCLYDRLYLNI